MKKLFEVIQHAEDLMTDFNAVEKYLLTKDIDPYRKSLNTYFGNLYCDDVYVVYTDSYGGAGFLAMGNDLSEAVNEYIDSLEPANDNEKEEWLESVNIQNILR